MKWFSAKILTLLIGLVVALAFGAGLVVLYEEDRVLKDRNGIELNRDNKEVFVSHWQAELDRLTLKASALARLPMVVRAIDEYDDTLLRASVLDARYEIAVYDFDGELFHSNAKFSKRFRKSKKSLIKAAGVYYLTSHARVLDVFGERIGYVRLRYPLLELAKDLKRQTKKTLAWFHKGSLAYSNIDVDARGMLLGKNPAITFAAKKMDQFSPQIDHVVFFHHPVEQKFQPPWEILAGILAIGLMLTVLCVAMYARATRQT